MLNTPNTSIRMSQIPASWHGQEITVTSFRVHAPKESATSLRDAVIAGILEIVFENDGITEIRPDGTLIAYWSAGEADVLQAIFAIQSWASSQCDGKPVRVSVAAVKHGKFKPEQSWQVDLTRSVREAVDLNSIQVLPPLPSIAKKEAEIIRCYAPVSAPGYDNATLEITSTYEMKETADSVASNRVFCLEAIAA